MASSSNHDVQVVTHPDGWAVERGERQIGVYFSRRFAVDAGREMARRDCVELLVFDGQRALDFRESYRATEPGSERRWRTKLGRRNARPTRPPLDPAPDAEAKELLHIEVPYDSWCLRVARSESGKALDGLCRGEVKDELLLGITELVLHATLRTRSDCALTITQLKDQIFVVVRGSRPRTAAAAARVGSVVGGLDAVRSLSDDCGEERTLAGESVWASFTLRG